MTALKIKHSRLAVESDSRQCGFVGIKNSVNLNE